MCAKKTISQDFGLEFFHQIALPGAIMGTLGNTGESSTPGSFYTVIVWRHSVGKTGLLHLQGLGDTGESDLCIASYTVESTVKQRIKQQSFIKQTVGVLFLQLAWVLKKFQVQGKLFGENPRSRKSY